MCSFKHTHTRAIIFSLSFRSISSTTSIVIIHICYCCLAVRAPGNSEQRSLRTTECMRTAALSAPFHFVSGRVKNTFRISRVCVLLLLAPIDLVSIFSIRFRRCRASFAIGRIEQRVLTNASLAVATTTTVSWHPAAASSCHYCFRTYFVWFPRCCCCCYCVVIVSGLATPTPLWYLNSGGVSSSLSIGPSCPTLMRRR